MSYMERVHIILPLALIFIFAAGGYVYFQAQDLIRGPIITITSPQDGARTTDVLLEIKGEAENISYISLNDRQIFINERGKFGEKLLLSRGYNIITVAAEDRFGREVKKALQVVYR